MDPNQPQDQSQNPQPLGDQGMGGGEPVGMPPVTAPGTGPVAPGAGMPSTEPQTPATPAGSPGSTVPPASEPTVPSPEPQIAPSQPTEGNDEDQGAVGGATQPPAGGGY